MTGEPVASRWLIVPRSADSSAAWNCSSDICRAARARIAANNSGGRGMLPMGSVGIGMVYGSLPATRNPIARQLNLRRFACQKTSLLFDLTGDSECENLTCDGRIAAILEKD